MGDEGGSWETRGGSWETGFGRWEKRNGDWGRIKNNLGRKLTLYGGRSGVGGTGDSGMGERRRYPLSKPS